MTSHWMINSCRNLLNHPSTSKSSASSAFALLNFRHTHPLTDTSARLSLTNKQSYFTPFCEGRVISPVFFFSRCIRPKMSANDHGQPSSFSNDTIMQMTDRKKSPLIQKLENVLNSFMERVVPSIPTFILRPLAMLLFWPTFWYNIYSQRRKHNSNVIGDQRKYYSRIDDHIILGALPYEELALELNQLGIKAVVNTIGEWHINETLYKKLNWQELYVPIIDFTAPTLAQVEEAVHFIRSCVNQKKTVYVHCKAGKGRSATMVLAYYIQERQMTPIEAQNFVQSKRPHIIHILYKRPVLQELYLKVKNNPKRLTFEK